jgi:hypothetical protein
VIEKSLELNPSGANASDGTGSGLTSESEGTILQPTPL